MSKKTSPTKPDVKTLTLSEFMRAATRMPDQESADELVREYAAHAELDGGYVRWFIVNWVEKHQPDEADAVRALYLPAAHAAELRRRAEITKRNTPKAA